jgi:hypothetical protein
VRPKSRQARLRSEYASWYPNVTVTTWYPVLTLVRKVTRQLVHGDPRSSPRWAVGGRTLDDRHFEFRGGVERDAGLRTRAGDTTVWPAAGDQPQPPTIPRQGPVREEKHRR